MLRKNGLLAIASFFIMFATGCAATRKDLDAALDPVKAELARQSEELATNRGDLRELRTLTASNLAALSSNDEELGKRLDASREELGKLGEMVVKRLEPIA